jgi:hypothetical protein
MRFSKSCGREVNTVKMARDPALLGTVANFAIALCQVFRIMVPGCCCWGSQQDSVDAVQLPIACQTAVDAYFLSLALSLGDVVNPPTRDFCCFSAVTNRWMLPNSRSKKFLS